MARSRTWESHASSRVRAQEAFPATLWGDEGEPEDTLCVVFPAGRKTCEIRATGPPVPSPSTERLRWR